MADEQEGRGEDADDGEAQVAVELLRDDLIRLPGGVAERHGEHFSHDSGLF